MDLAKIRNSIEQLSDNKFSLLFNLVNLIDEANDYFKERVVDQLQGLKMPISTDFSGDMEEQIENADTVEDLPENPEPIGQMVLDSVKYDQLSFVDNEILLSNLNIKLTIHNDEDDELKVSCYYNPIYFIPEVVSESSQYEHDLKGIAKNSRAVAAVRRKEKPTVDFKFDDSNVSDEAKRSVLFSLFNDRKILNAVAETFSRELLNGIILVSDLDNVSSGVDLGNDLKVLFFEDGSTKENLLIYLLVVAPNAKTFLNLCGVTDFSENVSMSGGARDQKLVSDYKYSTPSSFQNIETKSGLYNSGFYAYVPKKFLDKSFSQKVFDIGLKKLQPSFGVAKRGRELGGALRWRMQGSINLESISGNFIFQDNIPKLTISFKGYSAFYAWSYLKVGCITYTLATLNAGHENVTINIELKPWFDTISKKLYFVVDVAKIDASSLIADVDIRLTNFVPMVDFFVDLILSQVVTFFGNKEFGNLISTFGKILSIELFDLTSINAAQDLLRYPGLHSEKDSWLIGIGVDG